MKIAYLNSCYPAMSHTFIEREIEAVRAAGVDVRTFSCRRPGANDTLGDAHRRAAADTTYLRDGGMLLDQAMTFAARPLRYLRELSCSMRGNAYLAQAARLVQQMRRQNLRHVHVHMANNGAAIARIATRLDPTLSYSLTVHGPTDFFDVHALDLPGKLADARFVCAISDFCRSQLMIHTDPSQWHKLHIVHCGVNPRKYSEAQSNPTGKLRMVTVGRLAPVKGQLQLLEACDALTQRGIDWSVDIVGDGPLRATLEQHADRSRVTFSGAVSPEDVQRHYAAADLFVLPSFAEGVPVVLMEAMAMGLPVIATRVGGVAELVEDGVTGRVIAPGNVAQLTDAILEAARGEAPWVHARDARRAKVVNEFDIHHIGTQISGLFERYVAKPQAAFGEVALQI